MGYNRKRAKQQRRKRKAKKHRPPGRGAKVASGAAALVAVLLLPACRLFELNIEDKPGAHSHDSGQPEVPAFLSSAWTWVASAGAVVLAALGKVFLGRGGAITSSEE